MEEDLETPTTTTRDGAGCIPPYLSAPSSPRAGYYYSAPTSPMHFVSTTSSTTQPPPENPSSTASFEFDFSSKLTSDGSASPGGGGSGGLAAMSSADELFFNGQIRPMKLSSSHLQRPQMQLSPFLDCNDDDQAPGDGVVPRGRDLKQLRDKSVRRRTRSMSPLRSTLSLDWQEQDENLVKNEKRTGELETEKTGDPSSSSRSSSVGRGSKRWVFLKEFLYRSKSEGRNSGQKFWAGLSFSSPGVKDKKMEKFVKLEKLSTTQKKDEKKRVVAEVKGKRRVSGAPAPSAHELHYTANRAQAEEMRKKTFLPYRQSLLAGCLGFSSKSYGAWNGFARALNPVSSR